MEVTTRKRLRTPTPNEFNNCATQVFLSQCKMHRTSLKIGSELTARFLNYPNRSMGMVQLSNPLLVCRSRQSVTDHFSGDPAGRNTHRMLRFLYQSCDSLEGTLHNLDCFMDGNGYQSFVVLRASLQGTLHNLFRCFGIETEMLSIPLVFLSAYERIFARCFDM